MIRTDGTRPSLLVKKGTVDPDHPLATTWKQTLNRVLPKLLSRIAAVGRMEPATPSSNNFFGTGWLVAKDDDQTGGLILTNLHVAPNVHCSDCCFNMECGRAFSPPPPQRLLCQGLEDRDASRPGC